MKILENLDQNYRCIEHVKLMDFMEHMGCMGLEITYTDKNTQMLTTPTSKPNVRQSHDFDTIDEMYEFYDFLNKQV